MSGPTWVKRYIAPASEPVVRSGDKIHVHCPECGLLGTHAGVCSWSQMRSGRGWSFYAEASDLSRPTINKRRHQ